MFGLETGVPGEATEEDSPEQVRREKPPKVRIDEMRASLARP